MNSSNLNLITAVVAGLVSFASPCCLPLVPAYLSYITGVSIEQLTGAQVAIHRRQILLSAFAFVVGLAIIFTLLGASASAIGAFLLDYQEWVSRIAGVLIIIFGLQMLGVFRLRIFEQEKRMDFTKRRAAGPLGAVLMGAAFGVGWTPCVGPFLGAILTMAAQTGTVGSGMLLLFAYALGLGLPFVAVALVIGQMMPVLTRIKRHMATLNYAGGALLILMGFLVMTNQLAIITSYLVRVLGTGLAQ
jgi:cytochrome c-type biogenesis protein